ncbi:uncharacterized protein LOC142929336 isoform X1 [Petromyzon marinus]|uniref:uncharacterized protein LOC142929336 isoform X1 n=1 Tax=Petromyzon marinus TaxID=7757 RepID=UPI003F6F53DB
MPAMGLVGLLGMAVVLAECRGDDHIPVPPGGGEGFLIGNIFHNKTAITDRNHLEEELKEHVGEVDVSKMSEAEQEFYYFTMHDFDGNSFLDGLEMLAALADTLQESLGAVGPEERLAVYERELSPLPGSTTKITIIGRRRAILYRIRYCVVNTRRYWSLMNDCREAAVLEEPHAATEPQACRLTEPFDLRTCLRNCVHS